MGESSKRTAPSTPTGQAEPFFQDPSPRWARPENAPSGNASNCPIQYNPKNALLGARISPGREDPSGRWCRRAAQTGGLRRLVGWRAAILGDSYCSWQRSVVRVAKIRPVGATSSQAPSLSPVVFLPETSHETSDDISLWHDCRRGIATWGVEISCHSGQRRAAPGTEARCEIGGHLRRHSQLHLGRLGAASRSGRGADQRRSA